MEKGTMSTTTKLNHKAAPTTFHALIGELMPTAIHDQAAYGNALEMVRRLTVVPALNEDQARYLDTLCVLIAAYEKDYRKEPWHRQMNGERTMTSLGGKIR